jgi:hypothetical protein
MLESTKHALKTIQKVYLGHKLTLWYVGHALKVKTEAFINICFHSVHIKKITDILTVLPTYV